MSATPSRLILAALAFVVLARPAAARGQSQGQGLESRVSALESAVAGLTARVTTLETLPARVTALEARAATLESRTAPTFNTIVDCGSGQTIAAALAQTAAHTGTVVITFSGVCTESLTVMRARTIIQGGASGATIQAPAGSAAVRAGGSGSPFLTLSNMTITGAQTGVSVDAGAYVRLLNVNLIGNVNGVSLNNRSGASLVNTTIDSPAAPGSGIAVDVRNGAFVYQSPAARFATTKITRCSFRTVPSPTCGPPRSAATRTAADRVRFAAPWVCTAGRRCV